LEHLGVLSVAFSADGNEVVTGSQDGTIRVWDIQTGGMKREFDVGGEQWFCTYLPQVSDLESAYPGGPYLLINQPGTNSVRIINLLTGAAARNFFGHTAEVRGIALTQDGHYLLTGSADTMIKLWDVKTGDEIRTYHGHSDTVTAVAFNPKDSTQILSGSLDRTAIAWDSGTATPIFTFACHTGDITDVGFSPWEGSYAWSASTDSTVRKWSVWGSSEKSGGKAAASSKSSAGYEPFVLDLTSQKWRTSSEIQTPISPERHPEDTDPLWRHWLSVIVPDRIRTNTALLVITGGDMHDDAPDWSTLSGLDDTSAVAADIAVRTGSVVGILQDVPNQPLMFTSTGDETDHLSRSEDAIIAYTFDKYLDGGDSYWPALLPMVKSAVKAMDAIQEFCDPPASPTRPHLATRVDVEKFMVTGASKRGWTSWLTAAVDKRVVAIAPMVIDVLNMDQQMMHHRRAYGYWSPAIYEYAQMGVLERLIGINSQSPNDLVSSLLRIVDPYEYRARLSVPKLILNATGDEFFLPDSSRFYFKDLIGTKYVSYLPNADHSLSGASDLAAASLLAFYWQGVLMQAPLPQFSWTFESDGSIRVATVTTPISVALWQAHNDSARDFRLETIGAGWSSTSLEGDEEGVYLGTVTTPSKGWTAFFVQLTYTSPVPGAPLTFSTSVRVLPDRYPVFDGRSSSVGEGPDKAPVSVVHGTPFEMGYQYGRLMRLDIQTFIPQLIEHAQAVDAARFSDANLDTVWESVSNADATSRFADEVSGVAAGVADTLSDIDQWKTLLQRAHMIPVLDNAACSSLAAWRSATMNGHLYHTQNVDSALLFGAKAYEHPSMVVYIPDDGVPHVNVTFSGLVGTFAGMNLWGITLGAVGNPPTDPYGIEDLQGVDATQILRGILYDAHRLTNAVDIITNAVRIKRYDYIIGDGTWEHSAKKIRAWEPEPLEDPIVDNDPNDDNWPNVRPGLLYSICEETLVHLPNGDALLWDKIASDYGKHDPESMLELSQDVEAKDASTSLSNVMNVLYDADLTRLWAAYAHYTNEAPREAFDTPYIEVRLSDYLP